MDFSRTAELSKAWIAGSLMGGAVTGILFSALAGPVADRLGVFLIVFLGASLAFFLGLLIVGWPAWLIASRVGRNKWYDGMIIGAALAYSAMLLWVWAAGRATLSEMAVVALPVGVAGAASGLTVWRMLSV